MLPIKDITDDTVKWAMMFIIAKWISGGSLTDKAWQWSSLYTIIGFATYQISTRNFMDTGTGTRKLVLDDWIKNATMFATAQLLSGGSVFDHKWLYSTFATLIGFTVYDVFTIKYVKGDELTYKTGLQKIIDDWMKFGTMFIVARLLSCESFFDPAWINGCLGMLVGFSVYDATLAPMIEQIGN
jgi:hypothetical protein